MSGHLITIDDIDTFQKVRDFPATGATVPLQQVVRGLDEREELEPFLRAILTDTSDTPHGPSEIADILTHKLSVRKSAGPERVNDFETPTGGIE